jgi:hypothetical protein
MVNLPGGWQVVNGEYFNSKFGIYSPLTIDEPIL